MKLAFTLETDTHSTQSLQTEIHELVIAGWAGRDLAAIEHHIEELAAIGVPRPTKVPLYYRVAANQLTQAAEVQVLGAESSGEVEVFAFMHEGELLVSIVSDHTDRKLEAHSVALSKQICIKPVASTAWRFADVAGYWDELQVRSWIVEEGQRVLYQEGTLASLRPVMDLIADYSDNQGLKAGAGMSCGTVPAIGGIRPATVFEMELHDPRRQRSIRHTYTLSLLPEIL